MVAFWIFGAVNIEELISALSVDEVRSMHFEVPVLGQSGNLDQM